MPKIAVLPYGRKTGLLPSRIPLDSLTWPLGVPDGIAGKTLADLGPEDHLLTFVSDTMHTRLLFGVRARISVMVLEPAVIHARHMRLLRLSWRRFHRVLSCNEDLLGSIPNGLFFPFGGQWVHHDKDAGDKKTRECSLIASAKRSQEGHRLRHAIADWTLQQGLPVDVIGGGYKAFEEKVDGLLPYRYSVVIENARERSYFTEKLVDALLCATVPIYWGCPNIAEFFDVSGMIICDSEADIRQAIGQMSKPDYAARRSAIEATQERALHYGDVLGRAAQAVLDGS